MTLWPERISPKIYRERKKYFADLGVSIYEVSPKEHDKKMAYSQ
jgi:prephenate dehydrogenase